MHRIAAALQRAARGRAVLEDAIVVEQHTAARERVEVRRDDLGDVIVDAEVSPALRWRGLSLRAVAVRVVWRVREARGLVLCPWAHTQSSTSTIKMCGCGAADAADADAATASDDATRMRLEEAILSPKKRTSG